MESIALIVFLFIILSAVGYAVMLATQKSIDGELMLLLSSVVGVAVLLLSVFIISKFNVPVMYSAVPVAILAAAAAVAVILKIRPTINPPAFVSLGALQIFGLTLICYPLLKYGYDWVSYANDDMANYALGAKRFLENGYSDTSELKEISNGKDYSQAYWFMHAAGAQRSGAEIFLAIICALTGLNAHQAFMPAIILMNMCLLSATGALVRANTPNRYAPTCAMFLLAVSPMTWLGVLYQLLGQVGGLCFLAAILAIVFHVGTYESYLDRLKRNIPSIILFSAILIWYPEALPFFAAVCMAYLIIGISRREPHLKSLIISAISIALVAAVLLGSYFYDAFHFAFLQSGSIRSIEKDAFILFPYFLIPSGLPVFWGILPIAHATTDPYISLAIVLAIVLSAVYLVKVLRFQIVARNVPGLMVAIMLSLMLLFFWRGFDFGTFKLSMYLQPFIAASLAMFLCRTEKLFFRPRILVMMFVFASFNLYSHSINVNRSLADGGGALSEVPFGTTQQLNRRFQEKIGQMIKAYGSDITIILETPNVVLAKFQALYTTKIRTLFPARDYFEGIIGRREFDDRFTRLIEGTKQYDVVKLDGNNFQRLKNFSVGVSDAHYIYSNYKMDIFNSFYLEAGPEEFQFLDAINPQNRLFFIHSDLGPHYYSFFRRKAAFFQMESDPMFPGQKFSALGRYIQMGVINPDPSPRLVLELTSTVLKQHNSLLPRPKISGEEVNVVGRGSARLFTSILKLDALDEQRYVMLDIGRDGKMFYSEKPPLMDLYGSDVSEDQRRITVFARDISLISDAAYVNLRAPAFLSSFPNDLGNKSLEYSGLYEDGWISESAFFVLSALPSSKELVFEGQVPLIDKPNYATIIKLSVDGHVLISKRVTVGDFELRLPVVGLADRHRISIEFADFQKLPGADGRIVSAKIKFLGFK